MANEQGNLIEGIEELLYNLNKTPDQAPWFLVDKNDSVANHWVMVTEEITTYLHYQGIYICPECGRYRPDDERVKNKMKCVACAY